MAEGEQEVWELKFKSDASLVIRRRRGDWPM